MQVLDSESNSRLFRNTAQNRLNDHLMAISLAENQADFG